jgi:TetR/AcrR family transcriptional regulator, cholesterol catabolism regulator
MSSHALRRAGARDAAADRDRTNGRYAGRKARERAQRRSDVLASARRLFARKGYARSTMVEIAAAAELALGTLYQLFPSKEAILCQLLEAYIDGLTARVRGAIEETADPRTQLARVVDAQLAFSQENADVLRLYLSGWIGYEFTVRRQFGERIDDKYEEYLRLVGGVFSRGARLGAFASEPPRRLAVALGGMIHALIRRWLRERGLDLAAEGRALLRVVVDGVGRARRETGGRR